MLETLFEVEPTLDRHRNAPLLAEREAFLKHRQEQGTSRSALRHLSSALLNITIGLHLNSLREIDMNEIKEAARIWAETQRCNPRVRTYIHCVNYFTFTAKRWLLFLGKLKVPIVPRARFADQVDDFATYMTEEQGLTSQSVKMQCFRAATFLAWFAQRHRSLMAMRLDDIDEFLALKATGGWSRRTITSASGGIRAFLRYAECRGWCRADIATGIVAPTIYRLECLPDGPTREQVAMLLGTTTGKSVATVRAKALLALIAVYGLRSGEVSRLQLGDFDWRDETFLVDHSKRGGLKKYPLQRDVGDAILDYITNARPRVLCRNVFLTLTPPYRAVEPTVLSHLISKRIRKAGICCHHNGPHSLRHACATRLLEEGATFKEIGDFLGHRGSSAAGIYAKVNLTMLRQVADFTLEGLL
jgi:integrase/recombinase XerD